MSALRKRMLDYMHLRNYSEQTIKTYISWSLAYAKYSGQSPSCLDLDSVKLFLHYLLEERKASRSSINCAQSALKLLYTKVLDKEWDSIQNPSAMTPQDFTPYLIS